VLLENLFYECYPTVKMRDPALKDFSGLKRGPFWKMLAQRFLLK